MRSQSELDAEFTLDTVRDLDALLVRRAEATATAYTEFPVIRGLPYGPAAGETFHLFPPARPAGGLAPVAIFIHGGFWISMEAEQFSFLARGFVPFGAALVVIDYPLIPTVRMAGIVNACRRAIAYVHRHGRAHGLDSDRMFIAGNSAGGHLVAELMDRTWTHPAGLPDDVIKGGTAVSGLFDLRPVAASFRNQSLQFTRDEVERFSPLLRRPEIRSPTIVAVGGDETGEFLRQSEDFSQLVRSLGAPVEHNVVAGTNHITVLLDALADPDAPLNRAVRRQIGV
ncbi:MAG TPA: alpha/beta hydrolase [Acetobacteraceae bacterium]